ncbi:MAG: glycogen branching enzyme2C GH-57-type2C archaeal, partial [Segetibacter sp.]|nr:glycogen branching enzyme2C GH-57-type2C archaeal [Segetibacter sp.]
MTKLPEIPQLFYSTWGPDFYSEHWLKTVNCWMFAVIKFVEANIDLEKNKDALGAFEKFAGSDLMFIYPDKSQRELVREVFIRQYQSVAKFLSFEKREIAYTYPVDPFKTLFIYVTMDKPLTTPQFIIDKVSLTNGKTLKQISLEPECVEVANLIIYYQFFMLPPDANFSFHVENTSINTSFTSPTFGIPLHVVSQLKIKPKYDQTALYAKLNEIWGNKEDIPLITGPTKSSQSIHTKAELQTLLGGKRAAIFKYNKEFYSLLRFQELSPYTLQVVFDEVISLEDAAEYMHNKATKIPVVNEIDKIDTFDFDVLILTCALNFETEVAFFKALMRNALKKDIPVLSLYDDVLQYDIFDGAEVNENNFYRIGLPFQENLPTSMLSPEDCPKNVLGVFGTDTVQGKFTTQLYLREALKKYIHVTHWATEPTGSLLGAEIGYSRTDESMTKDQRIALERLSLKHLAEKCDLVITGGQNSIVFAPPGGNREKNSSTLIFNTFLPRFIILTVSVDTPMKLVEESIAYVAELAQKHQISSRVVAL